MGDAPLIGDLEGLDMESAVADGWRPFVKIRASGSKRGQYGRPLLLLGQLDPAELRAHALKCLEAAEAAEQDSLVARTVTKVLEGSDVETRNTTAAVLIQEIRQRRRAEESGG